MRAVAVRRFGESALMTDLPAPGAEDSVLIRVSYAGVNPVDWQLVDQLTPNSPFPFVLGVDVAGLAEHVPAQETRLHVGDRVFGMARTHGSYAEYTAVPTGGRTEPLARIPDSVSDDQAAALPVAAIAALGSLELLALAPGQRLVVMGAAAESEVTRFRWLWLAERVSSRPYAETPTPAKRTDWVPRTSTTSTP